MDPASPISCCNCGCPFSSDSFSPTFRRSVKRRANIPGRDDPPSDGFALVEVENELTVLRETVANHQGIIHKLSLDLEAERNASATSTRETMAMITRIQREKAEVEMELRQYRRFAEERIAHDGREISGLEDLIFKREQEARALACQTLTYKNRLISLGVNVGSDGIYLDSGYAYDLVQRKDDPYTALRCCTMVSCEEPSMNHEQPSFRQDASDPDISIFYPPPRHLVHYPAEDSSIPQEPSAIIDGDGEEEGDETDRIYTIDAVHSVTVVDESDKELSSVRLKQGSDQNGDSEGVREVGDIKKLHVRMQALEADREVMREAITSMKTEEKSQLLLLKEIAQKFSKEAKPEGKVVKKKPALFGILSFVSLIKDRMLKWWIECKRKIAEGSLQRKRVLPSIFWKKAFRSRYAFGLSSCNSGLLLLLDKSPPLDQQRCLRRTILR